eukprot:SAG31_NODE_1487_length_8148_cov_4.926823_4_plen_130_part_00
MCPLLEKYGNFIARCNALIEKVSTFIQRYTANSPRLPQIVDSSFNYAPKPRQRPPKYGAWYVPVDSWQIGGLAPPPEELTPQEKEQIERNFKRRQTLADEHPRNKMSKAYKHFLMREGLQVPHYLQSVQ